MAAADVEIPSQYKAVVYDDPGKISTSVDTLKTPEPGPGEVLIRLYGASPGTFQQYVTSQADYVTPIPDSLKSEDAAPMLCAGVTTYAALRRSQAKSGQWVVVSGAGGGLGHIAVQLASRGMALRVIGIDAGSKEKLVRDCGAEHFIDVAKHDEKSMVEEVTRTADGLGASAVIV
ncbi:MAG: hypothetical protein Q9220_007122 [cf. Caloplaca sp. 1 TL-2023]